MIMEKAIDKARETMNKNYGGPFGAVIVKDNKIIAVSSNTVLKDNDPTAHAEINAIREAGKKLGTYDLSGCTLYATAYPCPMCISAIIWANIKYVYYGTNLEDAEKIGFRDNNIYNFLRNNNDNKIIELSQKKHDECLKLFEEYSELDINTFAASHKQYQDKYAFHEAWRQLQTAGRGREVHSRYRCPQKRRNTLQPFSV